MMVRKAEPGQRRAPAQGCPQAVARAPVGPAHLRPVQAWAELRAAHRQPERAAGAAQVPALPAEAARSREMAARSLRETGAQGVQVLAVLTQPVAAQVARRAQV